jgi:hypothetical protein
MAATGFTPISLYHTTTAAAAPVAGNLVAGELALNTTDGKLYFKNTGGTVTLLSSSSATGGTFAAPVVIEGTTTDAALRITQLGTGNALLVEDSTNPDSTPFVINASGVNIQGYTSSITGAGGVVALSQVVSTTSAGGRQGFVYSSTTTAASNIDMAKSASPTIGTHAIVASGETLGTVRFSGSDGTNFFRAAEIGGFVDGTPGTNDMPGRLVFSTTADGASSPTERMRIDSAGNVGIGTDAPATKLVLAGNNTLLAENNTLRFWDTDTAIQTDQQVGKIEFYSSDATAPGPSVKAYMGAFADDSSPGVYLAFATDAETGTATEKMRITSAGNVGIGTNAPADKLEVKDGGIRIYNSAGTDADLRFANNASTAGKISYTSQNMTFTTAGSERMRIDSSGNVGIGTAAPLTALNVNGTGGELLRLSVTPDGGVIQEPALGFAMGVTNTHPAAKISALEFDASDSRASLLFYTRGDNSDSAPTERARIDNGGNLLVGTTTVGSANSNSLALRTTSAGCVFVNHINGTANGLAYASFSYNGSSIGTISQNGTTAVAYNTTSDYRLKENIAPLTGALARVAALKPCTYTWKAAPDETGEGFIAHELAEVCPQATTGSKDAVDAEGNPQYQGIDTSFLVATLTAALQEAHGLIKDLQARVSALEAA